MKSNNECSNVGNFISGAVVGGAIGAGLALLFAPRSGEETRKMLKDRAEKLGDDVKELKKDIEPKIEELKENISKKLEKAKK
jgi:gas vesicle protein